MANFASQLRGFRKILESQVPRMRCDPGSRKHVVSQGVPTVVSEAITWMPDSCKADSDDAVEIATVGMRLLNEGPREEIEALKRHNERAFKHWQKFLEA